MFIMIGPEPRPGAAPSTASSCTSTCSHQGSKLLTYGGFRRKGRGDATSRGLHQEWGGLSKE